MLMSFMKEIHYETALKLFIKIVPRLSIIMIKSGAYTGNALKCLPPTLKRIILCQGEEQCPMSMTKISVLQNAELM